MPVTFTLQHRDGAARAGRLTTAHGAVETPVFMPVGTQATVTRSICWAERCKKHQSRSDQALFAIVQGGTNLALREECARELAAMDFPGYALGGFSVGEGPDAMHAALPACAAMMPESKPR